MLLAIDIGNTNIVIGVIREDEILFKARIATDRLRTSDQYGVEIHNMLQVFNIRREDITDCIIASVVPPVFNSVYTGVIKVIGKQPLVVGPGLKTGLNIHVDIPSQVGADRIVAAVAALAEYKAPLVLIDMGTATTVEVVEPENVYMGGVIFPGVMVSLDSLTSRAAQLPGISLDKPRNVIVAYTQNVDWHVFGQHNEALRIHVSTHTAIGQQLARVLAQSTRFLNGNSQSRRIQHCPLLHFFDCI
jgi:type III pantothenate kinase